MSNPIKFKGIKTKSRLSDQKTEDYWALSKVHVEVKCQLRSWGKTVS